MRTKTLAFHLGLVLAAPLLLVGCDSTSGTATPTEPPSGLDFGATAFSLVNCGLLEPIVPTLEGEVGTTFTVEPALPEGLMIDPSTGAISGVLAAPEGANFVTVTAMNSLGSTQVGLTFNVANPAAPTAISVPTTESALFVGSSTSLGAAMVTGPAGVVYTFDVAPALPAGLSLDPATGAITGTPTDPVGPAAYTIRAMDCVGQFVDTNIVLGVGGGALNPATPNALAVANDDGTVSLFKVEPGTGVLQPVGFAQIPGTPGASPVDLVTSADQSQLFALLSDGSLVSVPLDSTGAGLLPSAFGPMTIPGLVSPGELVVGVNGTALYVADPGGNQVHALGLDSLGRTTPLPGSPLGFGTSPTSVDVSENGQFLFALQGTTNTLSVVELGSDGAFGASTTGMTGMGPQDVVTVDLGNGTTIAYVSNFTDGTVSVFSVSAGPTLNLLQTAPAPEGSGPEQLQVVEIGGQLFLYLNKSASNIITSLAIDPNTGMLDFAEGVFGQAGVVDFDFANDGSSGFLGLGMDNATQAVNVNPADGGLSLVTDAGRPQDCLRTHGTPVAATLIHSSSAQFLNTIQVFTANRDSSNLSEFNFNGNLSSVGNTLVEEGSLPIDVAASNDGRSLYVLNEGNFAGDDLFQFRVDGDGIGAREGFDLFGGAVAGTQGLAIDPSSRFPFISRDGGPGVINGFTADGFGGFTGVFSTATAANQPRGIIADPSGRFVYVANRSGNLVSHYSIDAQTGVPSFVSSYSPMPSGAGPVDVASNTGGCFLYVLLADAPTGQIEALSTNPGNGVLTRIGSTENAGTNPVAIAVHRSGAFLVTADAASGEIRRFSISDGTDGAFPGQAVFLGSTGAGGTPSDVQFSANGDALFVTLGDQDAVRRFQVDAAAGSLSSASDSATGDNPRAVAVRNAVQ